jgi:hypothetical protein
LNGQSSHRLGNKGELQSTMDESPSPIHIIDWTICWKPFCFGSWLFIDPSSLFISVAPQMTRWANAGLSGQQTSSAAVQSPFPSGVGMVFLFLLKHGVNAKRPIPKVIWSSFFYWRML